MSKVYTYKEIAEHNKNDDCWIIIDGKVYNVSKFLDEHPGGDEIIFDLAGTDATEHFEDIGHSDDALKLMKKLYIGDLDQSSEPVVVTKTETVTESGNWQGNANLVMIISAIFFAVGYYFANK